MLAEPNIGEQDLLAQRLEQEAHALTRRERVTEMASTLAFVAAVAALVIARPPQSFDVAGALLCVAVLVVASRIRFHVASAYTVPTQLAFVPLLFVVPAALVPVAMAMAFVLGRVPEVIRGEARPSRLVHGLGNSWFAIGPAAVFVAFGTDAWEASVPLLLVALFAQFAVDFAVYAARAAIEFGASLREQVRESSLYLVDAALSPVGLAIAYQVHERPIAIAGLAPLLWVLSSFARERAARLEGLMELKDAYQGTALVLGDVVEADDGYTGEHCKSVVRLALEVGAALGLDPERRRNLEFGALLHDVGKVAIPKEIINKPGKLDPVEWTIVKTHTLEGQRMLDRVGGFMRTVGLIVRCHHERWDGGGYPDGLLGEEIPLESRIISCCDSWNAMRTNRPYRDALSHEVAAQELVRNSGSQFDPSMVEVLLRVVAAEAPAPAPADPLLAPSFEGLLPGVAVDHSSS
jgi:putative nucleotidyltransferase with HDIG domain